MKKNNDLSIALGKLVDETGARSETARLRDIFDQVESTLSAGVKRDAVLAVLNKNGFSMTPASFKSALQRIRKERQENEKASSKK